MGLLGRDCGEGAAGECTMKGLWLPSDQPETQGAVTSQGEGKGEEGWGGEERGGLGLPHSLPLREGSGDYWEVGLGPGRI